jgi:hypothetical protein
MSDDVDMNAVVGAHDILFMTLDTLRFDVADRLMRSGETPHLARLIGPGGWERRHTPGSFTYAAHQAFFAGFLPTPARPGRHVRLFAASFGGSETTGQTTCVMQEADIVTGLAARGYHTICIGGVGFFNKQTALGSVLPNLFHESHWAPKLGVTDRDSTKNQFELAGERLRALAPEQRTFLFINVSALHQPNRFYIDGAAEDTIETHAAALRYVDSQLPLLLESLRDETFCIVCGDHGTAYGEDGFYGHRLAHQAVWDVPYAHAFYSAAKTSMEQR